MTPGDAFAQWVESQAGPEAARNARNLWPLLAAWLSGRNGATAATDAPLREPRGGARRSWRGVDRDLAVGLARLSVLTGATPGQIAVARCGDIAADGSGAAYWSIRRVGTRRSQRVALSEEAARVLAAVIAHGRGNGSGPGAEEPVIAGGWPVQRVRYAIRVGGGGHGREGREGRGEQGGEQHEQHEPHEAAAG